MTEPAPAIEPPYWAVIFTNQRRDDDQDEEYDRTAQRMEQLLESIAARLSLVEERQDFTDSLLRARTEAKELPSPREETWE